LPDFSERATLLLRSPFCVNYIFLLSDCNPVRFAAFGLGQEGDFSTACPLLRQPLCFSFSLPPSSDFFFGFRRGGRLLYRLPSLASTTFTAFFQLQFRPLAARISSERAR